MLGATINDGRPLPTFGVATYRTRITLPATVVNSHSVLMLEGVGSAYQVWVNGRLVGGLGHIGAPTDSVARTIETPQISVNLITITPAPQLDIVVQVSNYAFRESGIFGMVMIEQPNAATVSVVRRYVLPDVLLMGVFFVIGFYHLMTYFTSRRDIELIYMAGLCLSIALRSLCINKFLFHAIMPDLSWVIVMKLQYAMKFVALFTYIQLIRTLYRSDVNESVHRLFTIITAMALLYVVGVPPSTFTLSLNLQTATMVVILGYYLFVLSYVSLSRQREGAHLTMFGILFCAFVIIHDTYLFTQKIDSIQMVPVGMLVLMLVHATIISYRYMLFQQQNSQLAKELQEINYTLEAKIATRTAALHDSNAKLMELVEQRSQMMANIAHDMGSPMTGVQAALHILHADTLSSQDKKDLSRLLLSKVNHVKRLIDDLFRLARLESGQLEFDWETVAVADICHEIGEYFSQMLHEQGRTLVTNRLADTAYTVRVDRRQLYRVVQNLLDNAVKYSPDPLLPITMTCTIRLSHNDSRWWCVAIQDHGVGIAPEDVAMIFTRFYTRSEETVAGSGLGLAISKEIVELHGGQIQVTSRPDYGSTFEFTIPIIN